MNVDHHKVHYRPRASKTNLAVKMTVRPSPLPARSLLGTNSVPACFSSLQPSLLTSLLPVGPSIALAHARPHLAARPPSAETSERGIGRPTSVEAGDRGADGRGRQISEDVPVSGFNIRRRVGNLCETLRSTADLISI